MVMRVMSKKCLRKVMHWLCTEIRVKEKKDLLLVTLGCQLTLVHVFSDR